MQPRCQPVSAEPDRARPDVAMRSLQCRATKSPWLPSRFDRRLASRSDPTGRCGSRWSPSTHSHPHPKLNGQLTTWAPDAILHAGDIGDRAVLDNLATIAPVHAVRGNIDIREHDLPDVSSSAPAGCIYLTHIAVAGPRLRADVARRRARRARCWSCGHSHVLFIARSAASPCSTRARLARAGSTCPFLRHHRARSARRAAPHVEAETGEPWLPPPVSGLSI